MSRIVLGIISVIVLALIGAGVVNWIVEGMNPHDSYDPYD